MSVSMNVAHIFDRKRRSARKSANHSLKEARKLLRRAKHNVEADTRAKVQTHQDALREALDRDRVNEINRARDDLDKVLDARLDKFRKPAWRESTESILIAVAIALLLRTFLVEAFKIPSGSMIPTLAIGDQIFVNKIIYGMRVPSTAIRIVDFSLPERGDVVVFIKPQPPHEDYIKRVIGLPGDEVAVRGGVIFLNGEAVPRQELERGTYWDLDPTGRWYQFEAQAYRETLGDTEYTVLQDPGERQRDFGPMVVPEGHVFVMGDNRDNSSDSRRELGPVPLSNIEGRALFVWWSWGEDGLNFSRLGTPIH